MENWRKHLIKEFAGFEIPSDNTSRELLKRTIKRNAKNIASKSLKYRLLMNPITAFLTTLLYPSELGDATLPDEYVRKVADEYKKEKNKLDKKKKESDCDRTYPVQVDLSSYNLDPRIERKVRILLTDPKLCDIGVRIYKPDYFKRDGIFYTIQYCNMSTRQGRSSQDPGGPGGSVGISLPHKIQNFKDGPCLQGAVITSTRATRGWGPILYEVALEVASYLSFGLAADRGSPKTGVSPFAREVWAKYAMRSDIQSYQLDVDPDTTLDLKSVGLQNITPDRADDCNQTAAYRNPGGPMDNLIDHPLTLMYKKDNHNLYDALVDNNRMIDISG